MQNDPARESSVWSLLLLAPALLRSVEGGDKTPCAPRSALAGVCLVRFLGISSSSSNGGPVAHNWLVEHTKSAQAGAFCGCSVDSWGRSALSVPARSVVPQDTRVRVDHLH